MTATTLTRPSAVVRRPAAMALRDITPVIGSLVPFGMVLGVAMDALALHPAGALLGTALIYGGSAQLTAATLLSGGAGLGAVLATAVLIQARLLVYSAALEPRFRDQPAAFRWLGPAMIVDQTYALADARAAQLAAPADFRRYWLALGALLTAGWLSAVGAGMALGPVLPAVAPLRIAVPAVFVGLLVPRLRSRPAVAAAVAAAAITAASAPLPDHVSLLAGISGGAAAGWLAQRAGRKAPEVAR